jgi:hypothetical protein
VASGVNDEVARHAEVRVGISEFIVKVCEVTRIHSAIFSCIPRGQYSFAALINDFGACGRAHVRVVKFQNFTRFSEGNPEPLLKHS